MSEAWTDHSHVFTDGYRQRGSTKQRVDLYPTRRVTYRSERTLYPTNVEPSRVTYLGFLAGALTSQQIHVTDSPGHTCSLRESERILSANVAANILRVFSIVNIFPSP